MRVIQSIEFINGYWTILLGAGRTCPIKHVDVPVTSFAPGWRAKYVVDLGLDVRLLELVHDNGQEATWFLDGDCNHLSDRVALLPQPMRDSIVRAFSGPMRATYNDLLSAACPSLCDEGFVLSFVNESTIRQVIDLLADEAWIDCRTITADRFHEQTAALRPEGPPIRFDHLNSIFGMDLRTCLELAISDGCLRCPSPVSGAELRSSHTLVIHEHRMAFRFIEPAHGFVFYLGTTHHATRFADLYIPEARLAFTIFVNDGAAPNAGRAAEYLSHFVSHRDEIFSYLQTSSHKPAIVCRGYPGLHIGHQLWNELTAYERLLRNLGCDRLPVLVVPNAARGSEAYGPLDILFPEWAGKVDRSLRTEFETLGKFTYRKGYLLFRPLDQYVTASLSERLTRFAATTPTTSASRTRVANLLAQGFTLMTLGLRVENRTAINLYEMLEQAIAHVARKVSKLAVVIDGHNSRVDGDLAAPFDSLGQGYSRSPILIELDLALRLRQRFEYWDVQIINMVGGSVPDSIVWTSASTFFVAIWGAGLTKYRWVCNKPGLVVSSHWNLTTRHDLHIYDSAQFQENPAPILYVDPASVTDCPEAPVLFSSNSQLPGSYTNFHVDCAKLLPQLDALLEMVGVHPVPRALELGAA